MLTMTPLLSMAARIVCAATLAFAGLVATAGRGEAQYVAVVVNGEPITNYDIEQRTKLIQLSTRKTPPRKEVMDELIDEKLKHQLVRRYNIPDLSKDVDNAFTNMARRMRASPKQFTEQLAKSGLGTETIKSRIKAELIWSQIVRSRHQSSFQFSDRDIEARLGTRPPEESGVAGFDYTLRPILFIVPRGSPQAAYEARRREAEALRGRVQSCDQGIVLARGLRDVAVRTPVVRSSAQLDPALRDVLEKTEIGRLTPPELTIQGIEVHALCDKKPSKPEDLPGKREARDQLFKERFETLSKRFLAELRSQAMIEYR